MSLESIGLTSLPRPSMLLATMTYGGGRWSKAAHWLLGDPTIPIPRTLFELTLWPFYVLAVTWAAGGALLDRSLLMPGFIWASVVLALIGISYPSRRLVGGALVAFWWATIFVGPVLPGWRVWIGLGALLLTFTFLRLVDWVEKYRDRQYHAGRWWKEHAKRDRAVAAFLPGPLAVLSTDVPVTVPAVQGTKTLTRLKIVEVNRHFDSQLEASINGMLHERTQYAGKSFSIGISRFGFGIAGGTGYGQGVINLGLTGTSREDWTHENFVAVFETAGANGADVVRLIVPSDPSVHEYVQNLLWDWQRSLQVGSKSELLVRSYTSDLPARVVSDASYVADRLSAILRMEPSARPEISIVGTSVNDHALLGGAIQFGSDGRWYQLFPIALVNALGDLMNGRVPARAPQLPAPSGTEGAAEVEVARTGDGALATSNGQGTGTLSVSTIGQLSMRADDQEISNDLIQRPVVSFIWLYLLARAVRNPRDVISRAALADEVFPGVDPKQQRTRLRQRLSDLQTSLPEALSHCVVSEGERVRFNPDGAVVDVLSLRTAADALTTSVFPLDDAHLKALADLAAAMGDGMFLPEWEALERKVTSGRSGTSAVVEDARAVVDRWRASVLIAIADAYATRGKQLAAIPYLERVIQSHPQNEMATKKLVAAYLETGQGERARQLQEGKFATR